MTLEGAVNSGDQFEEIARLRSENQAFHSKLSDKNINIDRVFKINKDLEAHSITYNEKLSLLTKELESSKRELQRLRLRVGPRGAPYYQVI